jgi:hypothetical protein
VRKAMADKSRESSTNMPRSLRRLLLLLPACYYHPPPPLPLPHRSTFLRWISSTHHSFHTFVHVFHQLLVPCFSSTRRGVFSALSCYLPS